MGGTVFGSWIRAYATERTDPQQDDDERREEKQQPPPSADEGLLLRRLLRRLGGSVSRDVVVPACAGSRAGCHGRTMLATQALPGGSRCAGCVEFGRSASAGSGVPAGEGLTQVVPLARTAHLDHVAAGARVRRRHPHPGVDGPDTAVLLLQPVAVDVREE